ncbi:phosphoglycerate dehydrogenase [Melioribacteraceae bacterium 4301-Me]|uniref:phosphoglycerate dehydrogenase n=1 Tax=Pyranulibacter aquaticus TaxID=3163344 RepID=UPI00359BBA43
MKKRILIPEEISSHLINNLSADFSIDYQPKFTAKEILEVIGNYNIVIVRSKTKITSEIINAGKNLELICRAGTGVDNIDVEAATRRGIPVMNTPGGNTIAATEHTMALILSLCRHVPQANISLKSGKWERSKFNGTELYGKTIGIIGLGKIGREVALRAKSFGMSVIGYDPLISKEVADQFEVELCDYEKLISSSDIITLHIPLTDDTKNIISASTINKLKDGVKIINCARGGLVDEKAVLDGLNSGKISGAAFDVYTEEPPKNLELINHPKVVATPHLGASTEEAQEKIAIQLTEQIKAWLYNGKLEGCVNAINLKYINDEKVKPFLELAEKIGIIHSQILKGNFVKVMLNCYGSFLSKYLYVIKAAYLKGLIQNLASPPINYINSILIASEMGLSVEEKILPADKIYSTLFSATVVTNSESLTISGTVMLNNNSLITAIGDYHSEIKPEGNLLLYYNQDKPGVLSKVSAVLASFNINIAGLSLSRLGKGLDAMTIINTDEVVEQNVINELMKVEEIRKIYSIRFS